MKTEIVTLDISDYQKCKDIYIGEDAQGKFLKLLKKI